MGTILHPDALSVRERYKLMTQAIAPRPIALVSTVSADGVENLAPFSFFTGLGSDPMTLVFCPANDDQGREKDTLANCKPLQEGGTGQFVVNVVVDGCLRGAVASAEALPPEQSEFEFSGLTPVPSEIVKPPRVAQSPIAFECATMQVIRMKPHAPSGGNLVIGEILCIHAEEGLFDERLRADTKGLDLIGRMGGFEYLRTQDRFILRPGRAALEDGGDEAGHS